MEDLRSAIEDLRNWGEEWKRLAKSMFVDLNGSDKLKYINK